MNIKYLAFIAVLNAASAVVNAEDQRRSLDIPDPYAPISAWAVCPPQPSRDFLPQFSGDPEQAPTYLSGNLAKRDSQGTLVLIGDAEAQRGNQRLQADRIVFRELDNRMEAEGQVRYDEPLVSVSASHGTIWDDGAQGEFFDTRYRLFDRHARGKADKAFILEPGITRYKDATYTTCADDRKTWLVRASKVTLNDNTGEGIARNASLKIHNLPVLYTPYLSFPIDDRRKTGFLVPSFGSSDNSGFELRVPYYLNLAPNYDATITPRYLEDRGTQLNTEFRYLRPGQEGSLAVEYLPSDDITGDDRSRITIRDKTSFGAHLSTEIHYDRVSDKQYLDDLSDSLSLASTSFLPRSAQADYATRWWNLGIRLDDYQTIDTSVAEEDRPYQRLPRITFNTVSPVQPLGIESQMNSELVRFDKSKLVTADRLDLWPSISLPIRRSAFETVPKLGVRYTRYQLSDQDPGDPGSTDRTTPFFSLDNMLFFERDLNIGSKKYMHTLEPRLFYLYVKGSNQENIPLFDTTLPTFTYRELFAENRFNGGDRMGDANQVALAVTTRFLDSETGAEKLSASVGELFYFQNRNVTLNNTPPETVNESDIAGELELALSRAWKGNANLVWNPHDNNAERVNARIQYNPGFRKIANLSYRYIRGPQNQIDASFLWPLSPSWHALGRWYYDIGDTQTLETLAGLEYDSCCWGLRLLVRDYIDDASEDNRIYMLQFVLKGLTRFGSNIETVLEDGILGYSERPED